MLNRFIQTVKPTKIESGGDMISCETIPSIYMKFDSKMYLIARTIQSFITT